MNFENSTDCVDFWQKSVQTIGVDLLVNFGPNNRPMNCNDVKNFESEIPIICYHQYHYGRSGPLYMFFRNLSRTRHALADETFETPSIVVTVQCSTSVIERCHVPKSFDNHHEILIQLLTLAVYYASFLIQ